MLKDHPSLNALPDQPGVYFFKKGTKTLYVGKATSLRGRVRSYFLQGLGNTRSPLIARMVEEADRVEYKETPSVLEALILEAHEIKTKQPPYNSKDKDDKSYNYVIITKEDFPRVLIVRGRDLHLKPESYQPKAIFGPFPHGTQLREALKIVRKIFPFRDKCNPFDPKARPKPCFNRQIGLCPGVCTGEIGRKEYQKQIRHIVLFFEGKKKALIGSLEKEMRLYAKAREFEKAENIKRQIFALHHIQDVALIKHSSIPDSRHPTAGFRMEAYDIAHMGGSETVGVMVVMEDGELVKEEYRKFKIRGEGGVVTVDDVKNLREILVRRLGHAPPAGGWPLPHLIVIDGGKAQLQAAEQVLAERGFSIETVSVVKDEKHRPRDLIGRKKTLELHRADILKLNHEAHRFAITYHRLKARRGRLPR